MALTIAATRRDQVDYFASKVAEIALCTADPGTSGTISNEVTGGAYARKVPAFAAATDNGTEAEAVAGELEFDVPLGTTVTHVAYMNANGTVRNTVDSADISFTTAAGKIRVTPRHRSK